MKHPAGFFSTLRGVLLTPGRVFGRQYTGRADANALLFAIGVSILVLIAQQALVRVLPSLLDNIVSTSRLALILPARLEGREIIVNALLLPVLVSVLLVVHAAVLHILLWLAQSGERGYAVTLQTLCLCCGCLVLRLIPHTGNYAAIVCWLLMLALGLRLAHGSPWHRILPVVALHVSTAAWLLAIFEGWVRAPWV